MGGNNNLEKGGDFHKEFEQYKEDMKGRPIGPGVEAAVRKELEAGERHGYAIIRGEPDIDELRGKLIDSYPKGRLEKGNEGVDTGGSILDPSKVAEEAREHYVEGNLTKKDPESLISDLKNTKKFIEEEMIKEKPSDQLAGEIDRLREQYGIGGSPKALLKKIDKLILRYTEAKERNNQ